MVFKIEIEIGDKVKINPNSKYVKQACWSNNDFMKGEVCEKDGDWWRVKWSNNRINTYKNKDLILLIIETSAPIKIISSIAIK